MRLAIVGLGVMGRRRLAAAGADVIATADPVITTAMYRQIDDVPLDRFDAACVCVPDEQKVQIVEYLLSRGKHVLVEKPLMVDEETLGRFAAAASAANLACYTAYNHRFEPQLVRLKTVLEAGSLGKLYLVRMFYGNGTAGDVRESVWRDRGDGVLPDLGSHLLDLVHFLFGAPSVEFVPWASNRFENRAFDHVLFGSHGRPTFELECTLLSWRNTFSLDAYGERGSAHVHGLCKWGPSTLTVRRRVVPSGRPEEQVDVIEQPDPTWAAESRPFRSALRDRWQQSGE